jgi:hypothetical protein
VTAEKAAHPEPRQDDVGRAARLVGGDGETIVTKRRALRAPAASSGCGQDGPDKRRGNFRVPCRRRASPAPRRANRASVPCRRRIGEWWPWGAACVRCDEGVIDRCPDVTRRVDEVPSTEDDPPRLRHHRTRTLPQVTPRTEGSIASAIRRHARPHLPDSPRYEALEATFCAARCPRFVGHSS